MLLLSREHQIKQQLRGFIKLRGAGLDVMNGNDFGGRYQRRGIIESQIDTALVTSIFCDTGLFIFVLT